MPTVFIVHGHDRPVREELEKFLVALGLEILPFHRTAEKAGGIDEILKNVLNGVEQADVVMVLFTPEEQASFHNPDSGEYVSETDTGEPLAGWQPRPNVIFEAGVAIAAARDKTILLKMGPIRPMSDLGGVMFVELDAPGAKTILRDILRMRVPALADVTMAVESTPGSFTNLRRRRWRYHDEIGELEATLADINIPGTKKTILEFLMDYTQRRHTTAWNSGDIIDFAFNNYDRQRHDGSNTNALFWHLIVSGVFALIDIDADGDGWSDAVNQLWWVNLKPYVVLTTRGTALLRKIAVLNAQ